MKNNLVLIVLLAILMVLACSPDQAAAASDSDDRVAIQLIDSQEKAIADVTVNLIVYQFDARGQTAQAIPSGSCVTDANGHCEITVSADAPKDRSGFLRGVLDLGEHGKRSVLWPGGLLEVPVRLNKDGKVESDGEAAPFDYDETGGVQVVQPRPPLYLVGIPIGLLILGLSFYFYRRSKAQ